jgi:hypothetical protein
MLHHADERLLRLLLRLKQLEIACGTQRVLLLNQPQRKLCH